MTERKSIDELKKLIKKEFGSDFTKDPNTLKRVLPTGILSLDDLLRGGLRTDSYMELYGPEAVGKSYLAMNFMASCQRTWELPVAYFDFEQSWDPHRAASLGVDIDNMVHFAPGISETGFDILAAAMNGKTFGMIVVDSLAAMTPGYEDENLMEKNTMALQPRLNSLAMRKITPHLNDNIVIFINQMRDSMSQFTGPDSPGGRAIKHMMHTRLHCTRTALPKDLEKEYYSAKKDGMEKVKVAEGHSLKVLLKKSKFGGEGDYREFVYSQELEGIDLTKDKIQYLRRAGLITNPAQGYYAINGLEGKIHGVKSLYKTVESNPDHIEELVRRVQGS